MRDLRRYSAACLLAVFLVGGTALPVLHQFEHAAHETVHHDAFARQIGHIHTDDVGLSVALPDALLHDFQCVLCAKTLPSAIMTRAHAAALPERTPWGLSRATCLPAPPYLLSPIRGPPPVA